MHSCKAANGLTLLAGVKEFGWARGIHVVASGNTHSETWVGCCLRFGLRLFLRGYFGGCSSLVEVVRRVFVLLRGCFVCLFYDYFLLVTSSLGMANLGEILFR